MTHNKKRILTIGGGTGQFALLSGLRDLQDIDTTNGWWKGRRVIAVDLLDTTGGIVRHDSTKIF